VEAYSNQTSLNVRHFGFDRERLSLWFGAGILFSVALYCAQIPFPKHNATIKAVALGGAAFFWLARMVLEKRVIFSRTRLWWPLVAFTVITCAAVIGSIDLNYSLHQFKKYPVKSLFLFFAIISNVRRLEEIKTVLLALLISAGLFSLLGLINYLFFESSFGTRLTFPYFDTNANRFSKFYDVIIPVNLALILITTDKIRKIFFCTIFMLSICTVLLMQTRGSLVAISLGLVAIGTIYRKKVLLLILALILVVAITAPANMATRMGEMLRFDEYVKSEGVLNYRPDVWKASLRIIAEHPYLGLGLGKHNFGTTARKYNDLVILYDHAHNTYLEIAVERGLIGLAAFLWLFGSVFYYGFKHYLSLPRKDEEAILIFGILCGIGALFVHGLVSYFYKHEAFYTLWVMVAMLFALIEGKREKNHAKEG
jgi:putative inorganic carbon (HCO3(-)) transporter